MSDNQVYEKTHRSTLNRLKNRGTYDQETIHAIVNEATVLHVSFPPGDIDDDPFPVTLPMLGCMASYSSRDADLSDNATPSNPGPKSDANHLDAPSLYLHGHILSRLLKSPASTFVESHSGMWPPDSQPVTVAATILDGIVLAYTPFNHSVNYRSAVVHGWATLVTDPDEKMWVLTKMTDNIVPNRWDNSRVPPTQAEMQSTGVLKVDIISASAKVRAAGAGNPASDLADMPMRTKVWTGVVPASIQYGEPVPAEENLVEVPEYIRQWAQGTNTRNVQYTNKAASTIKVGK